MFQLYMQMTHEILLFTTKESEYIAIFANLLLVMSVSNYFKSAFIHFKATVI